MVSVEDLTLCDRACLLGRRWFVVIELDIVLDEVLVSGPLKTTKEAKRKYDKRVNKRGENENENKDCGN
jgi:hypothetical protein